MYNSHTYIYTRKYIYIYTQLYTHTYYFKDKLGAQTDWRTMCTVTAAVDSRATNTAIIQLQQPLRNIGNFSIIIIYEYIYIYYWNSYSSKIFLWIMFRLCSWTRPHRTIKTQKLCKNHVNPPAPPSQMTAAVVYRNVSKIIVYSLRLLYYTVVFL